MYDGGVLAVSGDVSGLDGGAFTVKVDWGDGAGTQSFLFAAGQTSFSVRHCYDGPTGTCSISLSVVPTDNSDQREADYTTGTSLIDPGPVVTLTGFPQDTSSPCRLVAAAYEWWNPDAPEGYYTYHWAAADVDISDQAEADFPADGGEVTLDAAIQSGFGHLTVTDNFGNGTTTTVSANQWYALPSATAGRADGEHFGDGHGDEPDGACGEPREFRYSRGRGDHRANRAADGAV